MCHESCVHQVTSVLYQVFTQWPLSCVPQWRLSWVMCPPVATVISYVSLSGHCHDSCLHQWPVPWVICPPVANVMSHVSTSGQCHESFVPQWQVTWVICPLVAIVMSHVSTSGKCLDIPEISKRVTNIKAKVSHTGFVYWPVYHRTKNLPIQLSHWSRTHKQHISWDTVNLAAL